MADILREVWDLIGLKFVVALVVVGVIIFSGQYFYVQHVSGTQQQLQNNICQVVKLDGRVQRTFWLKAAKRSDARAVIDTGVAQQLDLQAARTDRSSAAQYEKINQNFPDC